MPSRQPLKTERDIWDGYYPMFELVLGFLKGDFRQVEDAYKEYKEFIQCYDTLVNSPMDIVTGMLGALYHLANDRPDMGANDLLAIENHLMPKEWEKIYIPAIVSNELAIMMGVLAGAKLF
jgi:hypothetical protein